MAKKPAKPETFTCVCGKKFIIGERAIECYGPGHYVYKSPEYWTYTLDKKGEEKKKIQDSQPTLF